MVVESKGKVLQTGFCGALIPGEFTGALLSIGALCALQVSGKQYVSENATPSAERIVKSSASAWLFRMVDLPRDVVRTNYLW